MCCISGLVPKSELSHSPQIHHGLLYKPCHHRGKNQKKLILTHYKGDCHHRGKNKKNFILTHYKSDSLHMNKNRNNTFKCLWLLQSFDLWSNFLTFGKVQTSLTLPSLNRNLHAKCHAFVFKNEFLSLSLITYHITVVITNI